LVVNDAYVARAQVSKKPEGLAIILNIIGEHEAY